MHSAESSWLILGTQYVHVRLDFFNDNANARQSLFWRNNKHQQPNDRSFGPFSTCLTSHVHGPKCLTFAYVLTLPSKTLYFSEFCWYRIRGHKPRRARLQSRNVPLDFRKVSNNARLENARASQIRAKTAKKGLVIKGGVRDSQK